MDRSKLTLLSVSLGGGLVVAWVVLGWWLPLLSTDRGTFGDGFGAVAALFSGLALMAVAGTLFLQRQELALQRQELAETRREMRGQRQALETQTEMMRLQAFESAFLGLLELHVRERSNFHGPIPEADPGDSTLRAVSEELIRRTTSTYESLKGLEIARNWQQMRTELVAAVSSWLSEIRVDMYASRIAQLAALLNRSPQVELHADLLRTSLTADEIVLLVAKALELPTKSLAFAVSEYEIAKRVQTKVGPRPQVLWIVDVMTAYGMSTQ